MNILFLLIASALIFIAWLVLLPPLWRKNTLSDAAMDERNIAIAKHRLKELKEQLTSGILNQIQYEEQKLELELALSDDLDIKTPALPLPSQNRTMVYVLVLAVPLLAALLYAKLGNYSAITKSNEAVVENNTTSNPAGMEKMVAVLAAKMEKNPKDTEGWIMLGRSYDYLQQYSKAASAFAHAYALLGDKPEVMLLYANSLAYANEQQVTGKAAELVFKALKLEPDNLSGLWLGGMAKAQAGDFAEAKALWIKLKGLLPAKSEGLAEVDALLAKIDEQSGEVATPATTAPARIDPQTNETAPAAATDVVINLQVSLDKNLQQQAAPDDTVFVYAQAVSGSKMPLAIVRKKVSDLPLTMSLDDSNAMSPMAKLSGVSEVKLLARISKSGSAMAQVGDLMGIIERAAVTDKKPHTLVINSQKK